MRYTVRNGHSKHGDVMDMPEELWCRKTYAGANRGPRYTGVEQLNKRNNYKPSLKHRVKYILDNGMTLPNLPEGWHYRSIENLLEYGWRVTYLMTGTDFYYTEYGPTPRAAALAAISKIERVTP